MKRIYRVRIAGIGGQGVVHLAKSIAQAAFSEGTAVSMIERPRSAMRLGPIACDLVFHQENFAPFIPEGEADIVIGLEPLDGVMNAFYYANSASKVFFKDMEVLTIEEVVLEERDERRDAWLKKLEEQGTAVYSIADEGIADRGYNYYMLGSVLKLVNDFPVSMDAIKRQLEGQTVNLSCLEKGYAEA